MLDIVFFTIVASFIILKLFKAIGRVDQDHHNQYKNSTQVFPNNISNTNNEPNPRSLLEEGLSEDIKSVFDKIRKYDYEFDAENFINGTQKAFDMIIKALSKGDRDTLKHLLSNDVFDSFSKEINKRKKLGQVHDVTIVGMKSVEIIDASIKNLVASIKVKIISEQMKVVKDTDGNIIEGNLSHIYDARDIWSFSKNIKKDKVWRVTET